jgi:hypothetical protein
VGEIVELRDGTYAGGGGRVRRHIGHTLTVQQHSAAITEAAHVFIATPSHTTRLLTSLSVRSRRQTVQRLSDFPSEQINFFPRSPWNARL